MRANSEFGEQKIWQPTSTSRPPAGTVFSGGCRLNPIRLSLPVGAETRPVLIGEGGSPGRTLKEGAMTRPLMVCRIALTALALAPAGCAVPDRIGEGVFATGRTCEVHAVPLRLDMVPVTFGFPAPCPAEDQAEAARFPNAATTFHGGCAVVSPDRAAVVRFCPECRLAEAAWRGEADRRAAAARAGAAGEGADPTRLAGEYRAGGPLTDYQLVLREDGSYRFTWSGCLGACGTASGAWSASGGAVALTARDLGGLRAGVAPARLIVVGLGPHRLLVREEDRARYDEGGPSRFYCYHTAEAIDAVDEACRRREAGPPGASERPR
jgi:hypothetical protein